MLLTAEKDLNILLSTLEIAHNKGQYVFAEYDEKKQIGFDKIIGFFREKEGNTVILEKTYADEIGLAYNYVASWLTVNVHSSLEAVGFTAAISKALSQENISANIVAALYHDHIFVSEKETNSAIMTLEALSKKYQ